MAANTRAAGELQYRQRPLRIDAHQSCVDVVVSQPPRQALFDVNEIQFEPLLIHF